MASQLSKEDNMTEGLTNNEGYLVPPLPHEMINGKNILEIYTLDSFLKNLMPLNTALAATTDRLGYDNESTFTAEAQQAHLRADTLRQASMKHSWTRATAMTIGRSAIGSGFTITKHPVYGVRDGNHQVDPSINYDQLKPIYDFFYSPQGDDIIYIQDIFPNASKIMYTMTSLVYYGQAAWEIQYDANGKATGFDVLPGFMVPNISAKGKFLRPAYYFRPWNSVKTYEYRNPNQIIYFTWPGTDFSVFGSSEYNAAAESAIPSDLYAAAVYRSHFENVNAPFNGYWTVNPATSDEDFKRFMALVFNRYTGARNFGRNPIVIRGDAEFKEMRSRANDDAPYLEGRQKNQEEISALSGVSSSKLGLGQGVNRTNFREQRRDFWESTLRPLYSIVEEVIYKQVFVRLFKMPEWTLTFNNPDLSTALEEATIYTRYVQNGIMNPNEARFELNMPPRPDNGGLQFFDPPTAQGQPGLSPEGGQGQPAGTDRNQPDQGSRATDNQRPPTADRPQNDQGSPNKSLILDELRTWKKFAIKVAEGARPARKFSSDIISKDIQDDINTFLNNNTDKNYIKTFFDEVIDVFDDLVQE